MTRARATWVALGLLGTIVLVAFDTPVTLTIGVFCLLAFVAYGVTLIASPEFLAAEEEEPER